MNKKKAIKETIGQEIGIHCLKMPKGSRKRKKILGRGSSSGHGKTSTRGSKGQTSRAGRDFYPGFEGGQTPIIRRMPKRGFTNKFKREYRIVNLNTLSGVKEQNITINLLKEKGFLRNSDKFVKILGIGEVSTPLVVQAHAVSKNAMEKITKAGGKVEIINA